MKTKNLQSTHFHVKKPQLSEKNVFKRVENLQNRKKTSFFYKKRVFLKVYIF